MTSLIASALPSLLPRATAPAHDRRVHAKESARDHRPGQPHLIDESLFRDALVKERKRADRFDQPFMLVVIAAKNEAASESPSSWRPAIGALRSIMGETDVLGWLEKGTALGLILPEIRTTDAAGQRTLYKKLRRELTRRLNAEAAMDGFSIRLHVHDGAMAAGPTAGESLPFDLQCRTGGAMVRDAMKRGVDIIGSAVLLALLLPVFVAIATLVKLTSRGPVLFGQERIGQMGRPFRMLKFRTMYVNAGPAIHQEYVRRFISSNERADGSAAEGVFKIVNDPRITPIGRVLRKTSLDELPQFWNVLRGEMSLVGPRPPLQYEVEQYKPWHYRRVLEARPGITGLWQVTGRSRTTFDDMVRLDLRYARTHSAWTDMKILLATPRAVISGKGAC